MQKHVSKRLGCVTAHGGEEAIKHHSFFRDVKWKDLEDRKIKPPFRPKIVSRIVHFRPAFDVFYFFLFINPIGIVIYHNDIQLFTEKQKRRVEFRPRVYKRRASFNSRKSRIGTDDQSRRICWLLFL